MGYRDLLGVKWQGESLMRATSNDSRATLGAFFRVNALGHNRVLLGQVLAWSTGHLSLASYPQYQDS